MLHADLPVGDQAKGEALLLIRNPAVLVTDWVAFIILLAWSIILAHKIASFKFDESRVDNYFSGYQLTKIL